MNRNVGRNQPCPCGSKKKYKHCCFGKDAQSSVKSRNFLILGGALVIVAVVAFIILSNDSSNSSFQAGAPGASGVSGAPGIPGSAAPAGAPPPGKVWSTEHGHWHDAPGFLPAGSTDSLAARGATTGLATQPPGEAPPGKVWSPEHGHWHDIPVTPTIKLVDDSLR